MTTIKITQLTDIGANLATSTVLPVVNMAGTPTTQKTTVGNIANLALSQAGNSYPAAAQAVLAQTVTNAAQPNITSVGTLTTLAVSGNVTVNGNITSNNNVTVNGNITSNGTAYVGNLSTTGVASITTLNVGATANLGAVGNVTITGGTVGQVLTTNGSNVLSWTNATLSGDGGNISNIAGANVTGTVGNANLAQFIDVSDVNNNFSYHVVLSAGSGDKSVHIDADDNLQYNPADGTLTATRVDATYVLADLQFANGYPAANVTGLGNIALSNYDGNASNVLHGDGSWSADTTTYSNSNVASYLPTYTGNVGVNTLLFSDNSFQATAFVGTATTAEGLSNVGNATIVVDPLGANVAWTFGNTGLLTFPGTPRIDTSANNFEVQAAEAINFEANTVVNIYTDTGNTTYQWQFGDDGNLTIPGNLIAATASPAPILSGFGIVSAESFTSSVVVYANLPVATTAGRRAFISDANLIAVGNFGNVVGGGGSNTVCVWSDGTDWRIG